MDEESALEELTRKYDADAPLRSVQKFDLMVRKELNPERRGRPRKADGTESSDED